MELLARLGGLTRLGRRAYRSAHLERIRTSRLAQLGRSQDRATARARVARMAANGFDARARVVESRPTGQEIAGEPVVEFDITVAIDGRSPYPLSVRRTVPAASSVRLTPGTTLAVKVDRNDQSVVWIDFDRTL
ncbi:MAG: hypothetical protein ACRDLP_14260 [Solirubrobacteraceae bacterium]